MLYWSIGRYTFAAPTDGIAIRRCRGFLRRAGLSREYLSAEQISEATYRTRLGWFVSRSPRYAVAPIEFSDEIIDTPVLYGELFPVVFNRSE